MKSRVAEVDKQYPPHKKLDANKRIVCVSLVTYCPQAIYDSGRVHEFFEWVDKVQRQVFGTENVHGTAAHLDELHNYIDTDGTERSSLAHGHSLVSAYAEWTDDNGKERKGINGKNFQTRPKMNELNKAIDEMCRREFGVPYMTGKGKGKGSGKSVEAAKAETQLRMAKKANEDFVRGLEVEQTKTTKNFLGQKKEVPKTPEEIHRDTEVRAAQAVLKDKDEIAERERKVAERESELTADEEKLAEYAEQVDDDAKMKVAAVEQKYQAQLNAINEQHEQEKQSLLAKVESKLKELSQQIKVAKDATFAAIAQKAAYVLERVPLPATTELFVRGDYCREQTHQKER